jgi:hypothetical protein
MILLARLMSRWSQAAKVNVVEMPDWIGFIFAIYSSVEVQIAG